jgi:hypothetical protein
LAAGLAPPDVRAVEGGFFERCCFAMSLPYRSHPSSAVATSVFSSRYFTMTGV